MSTLVVMFTSIDLQKRIACCSLIHGYMVNLVVLNLITPCILACRNPRFWVNNTDLSGGLFKLANDFRVLDHRKSSTFYVSRGYFLFI